MRKYRVFGHVEVVVSTVITAEEGLNREDIFDIASSKFGGISQLVGNGGCGDKMIGVNGSEDTIMVDDNPTFDDFTEEL